MLTPSPMKATFVAILLIFAVVFSAALLTMIAPAQQPLPKIQVQHAPLQGKVEVRPAAQLTKFKSEVTRVPAISPPIREGHRWHWHPLYGWVSLPLVGAPEQILLPVNYALPPQVAVYQAPTGVQLQGTCPHCGQPITVTLQ